MSNRVTRSQLAKYLNINRSTVSRYVKRGRLELDADGKVELEDALRQLDGTESMEPHHQARKNQIESEKSQVGPELSESVSSQLKKAALRERAAKAHKAEMEAQQMAGELVKVEEVEFVLTDFGAILRGLVERLPDRLAAEIAGAGSDHRAIHAILDDYARTLLDEITELLKRRGKEWRPAA